MYCITSTWREGLATLAQFLWPVNMTNQIQARAVIRNFECTWSRDQSKFVRVWSNFNVLPTDSGDHTTSCYAQGAFHKTAPEWPDACWWCYTSYILGSGLVHDTNHTMLRLIQVQDLLVYYTKYYNADSETGKESRFVNECNIHII